MSGMASGSAKSVHRLCVADWFYRERGGFYQESAAGPNRGKAASCAARGRRNRPRRPCGACHMTFSKDRGEGLVFMRIDCLGGSEYQPAYLPRKDLPGGHGGCAPERFGEDMTTEHRKELPVMRCDVRHECGSTFPLVGSGCRSTLLATSRPGKNFLEIPGIPVGLVRGPTVGFVASSRDAGSGETFLHSAGSAGLGGCAGVPAAVEVAGVNLDGRWPAESSHLDGAPSETLMAGHTLMPNLGGGSYQSVAKSGFRIKVSVKGRGVECGNSPARCQNSPACGAVLTGRAGSAGNSPVFSPVPDAQPLCAVGVHGEKTGEFCRVEWGHRKRTTRGGKNLMHAREIDELKARLARLGGVLADLEKALSAFVPTTAAAGPEAREGLGGGARPETTPGLRAS